MFNFGFSEDHSNEENNDGEINTRFSWFPAVEINVTAEQIAYDYDDDDCTTINTICNINIKLIREDIVMLKLENDHENIMKAESEHSDLLPAIYEGGLKVWECSYDLAEHLITQCISFKNLKVLDLGCGAGILGIIALLSGSTVHFQDYNKEVIELVTIPNVLLNLDNRELINEKVEFYAGDWTSFTETISKKYPDENEKYDIILSSETIYNSENQKKLYNVFKERLKINGVGYIAAKTYYFGVGGGMRQFEKVVSDDNTFNIENVWRSDKGLQREIVKIIRQ